MALNAFELACLEEHRRGSERATISESGDETSWLQVAIASALEAAGPARALRTAPLNELVSFKPDGSPVTTRERDIEDSIRNHFHAACSEVVVVGEEGGGEADSSRTTVAVDPIDGTWSLLSRTASHTISLAILKQGQPFVSVVLNPATGELAYAGRQTSSRLVQLSIFGEADQAASLPMEKVNEHAILVNVHPSRQAIDLMAALYRSWNANKIRMVRSPGGSPSWALLEAAKGSFVYVNLWSPEPADPYDLVPGVQLVQGAGGKILSYGGQVVDPQSHRGPFVAGIGDRACDQVLEILGESLSP